jgi:hypothetical protein
MEKGKKIEKIKIDGISFPFFMDNKNSTDKKASIANISLCVKTNLKNEDSFRNDIYNIIKKDAQGSSLNNLLTLLLKYINSINAVNAEIIAAYPYFIFKTMGGTDKGYLKRYTCTLSVKKQSLMKYKKKFIMEVPVLIKRHRIPGEEKEAVNLSTNLTLEIDGFEPFDAEDIAAVIEKYTGDISGNNFTRLPGYIKKELAARYIFDKCTVKLVDQKINNIKIPELHTPALYIQRDFNGNNYSCSLL